MCIQHRNLWVNPNWRVKAPNVWAIAIDWVHQSSMGDTEMILNAIRSRSSCDNEIRFVGLDNAVPGKDKLLLSGCQRAG
jgi:hypothetical protein